MDSSQKLQADQLQVYRSGKEVLSGISFSVGSGEVYALLGGNGAGKSTTLLSFLGFLPPAGGSVSVNDVEVGTDLEAAREAIAYLPESASLYEHLNAYENLRYFLQLARITEDSAAIEAALDRVSLNPESRTRNLKEYSKGMRQKVAIALAILRDTDILLLDEPTSGLDPSAIDEFHHLVRDLADAGKTILMVTHDVYGACQVADRIGLLRGGKLVGEFAAPEGGRIETETVHRAFSERESGNEQVA
ncbi:MAG: ABC transporter ATP-binding protein [Pseudomonadota bacterium]